MFPFHRCWACPKWDTDHGEDGRYFLATPDVEGAGLWSGATDDATRTIVPVVRESDGLTITLSDSVTPLRISL
jgi:hypothetical protein